MSNDLERRLTLAILGRTAPDAAREVLGIFQQELESLREELAAENEALKKSGRALLNAKHKEAAEAKLWFEKGQALTVENERLREALRVMIYETTHLSPMEPDGSHWCRITADALNTARAALGESHD